MKRTISLTGTLLASLWLGVGCAGDSDDDMPMDTSVIPEETGTPDPEETAATDTSNMQTDPKVVLAFQNITVLRFGPDGTLYVADSGDGTVSALTPPASSNADAKLGYNLRNLDGEIADVLGTTSANLRIKDLAVHPMTREAYLAVSRVSDDAYASAIVVINQAGDIRLLDPDLEVDATVVVPFAPTDEFFFYGEFPSRDLSFTDLEVYDGQLIIAGMSNADFASTLWTTPLPFSGVPTVTTTEIYHAIHAQLETRAPIRTMAVMDLDGTDYVVAAYTCTPLVVFPIADLVDGTEVRGKTIGELGYGNTPGDMVTFTTTDAEGGPIDALFVQNKNQGGQVLFKPAIEAATAAPGLSEPVGIGTKVDLGAVEPPMTGIIHLADQDPGRLLAIRRDIDQGDLELVSFLKGVYFRLSDFQSEYEVPNYVYPPEQEPIRQFQNMLKIEEGYPEYVSK
ncbi:MAG: hypothetical protein AAGA48_28880 [Myxococcota bacterium]